MRLDHLRSKQNGLRYALMRPERCKLSEKSTKSLRGRCGGWVPYMCTAGPTTKQSIDFYRGGDGPASCTLNVPWLKRN